MKLREARAIMYSVVALLAVTAVLFTKPLPPRNPAAEVLSDEHAAHRWRERTDTLRRNENLMSVLARGGVSEVLAREALKAARTLDFRRIPANMQVRTRTEVDDSIPSEIILKLAEDRLLLLKRDSAGWSGVEQQLPWTVDTIVVAGTIKTNLYAAMDSAAIDVLPRAARDAVVNKMAEDIFEYRVDMSRDLQVGDKFRVVVQRRTGPNGITRMDTVLGATMTLSGVTTEAVRFRSAKVDGIYFDQNGKPMRTGFLRNPIRFSRITSGFGGRRHPILGTVRNHQGTDYGAAPGTDIRAIGDGTVIRANFHSGYGNVVDIRHANGYMSRYAHMRGFARGIYAGARVSREQTIGYVGSTGLSTGPHLHFEVHVRGVQKNPRVVLANITAEPIPASERSIFDETRIRTLMLLSNPALLASAKSSPSAPSIKQAGSPQ